MVIIVLLRVEKNYEIEKTYKTARVAVFAKYRGETPMHELVPHMEGLMWNFWSTSKAKTPEEHADDTTNHGCFNEWFGADMEPKGEGGDEAVVESIFEVLAGACNIRPNPDPNPNPQPVITRSLMEGKGANGMTIKGYPRPGSEGVLRNVVAFTFQMETVGPAYEMAMDRALKVMAEQMAKEWKSEDIKLVWHDSDSNHHAAQCMSTVSATGVWGVALNRVTRDEINDAVVTAGFAEPISIITRTMKHPSKADSLSHYSSTWGAKSERRQGTGCWGWRGCN